jgi:hypothetical protein
LPFETEEGSGAVHVVGEHITGDDGVWSIRAFAPPLVAFSISDKARALEQGSLR